MSLPIEGITEPRKDLASSHSRAQRRGWHATGAMFWQFHLAFYLCGPQAGSVASMGIGRDKFYTMDPSRVSGAQLTMTEAGKDCRIVHVGATLGLISYQW